MRGACQAPASTRPDSDGFAAARRALEWRSRGRRPPRRAKCARVRVTATRGAKVRTKQKPPAPPPLPLAADPIAFHVLSRHYSVGPLLLTYHFGGQPPPQLTRQTSQFSRAKIAATATPPNAGHPPVGVIITVASSLHPFTLYFIKTPSKKSRSPNAEKQRVGARPSVRSSALGDGGFVEGPSSVRLILAGVVRSQSLRCQTIYSSCRRLAGPAVGVRALRFLPRSASLTMAVEGAHALVPDGPAQRGRGIHGQYVYWMTMSHPRPETVQQLSLRTLALLPTPPSCLTAPELRSRLAPEPPPPRRRRARRCVAPTYLHR